MIRTILDWIAEAYRLRGLDFDQGPRVRPEHAPCPERGAFQAPWVTGS